MPDDIRDTIARVAQEEGIDPSYALAVADRESKFNPNAHNSKSIAGLFQMTGALRQQYGAGDSSDPAEQTRAFARFTKDLQGEMAATLGRQPTSAETYLGHFWGGNRAARVIASGQGGLPPQDVFSPRELAANPELAKGENMGALASGIMADIGQRAAKYGAPAASGQTGTDFASYGDPKGLNFAQFGQPDDGSLTGDAPTVTGAGTGSADDSGKIVPTGRPGADIDVAQFGIAQSAPQPDFSTFGASQPPAQAMT